MILSDRDLRKAMKDGRLVITPFNPSMVQPSSIDLHVDSKFRIFANTRYPYIDVKKKMEDLTELVEVAPDQPFILHPGEFVLGSTLERVRLADDLVARLEGKSSLGRLGLLIHSSLPAGETVLILEEGRLSLRPIDEIVAKRVRGAVVGFDPETFEVGYHEITGWYEGPRDRIFEVILASGRRVRVTAGHNLFSLDRDGNLKKVRTAELGTGTRVAVPRRIPDPPTPHTHIDAVSLAPESSWPYLILTGPAVAAAFRRQRKEVASALRGEGYRHVTFYESRNRLPLPVAAQLQGLLASLGDEDRIGWRGSARVMPVHLEIDSDLAWLLGLYVAEGYRRANQIVVSNTDDSILDRAQRSFEALGFPVYRRNGCAVTCSSSLVSALFDWLGAGTGARSKRIPPAVFGWPRPLIESFLEGLVDGDGSVEPTRVSVWTSSAGLADDLLTLSARLELRASFCYRDRSGRPAFQISMPFREHKMLTAVPLPDRLLVELREEAGLSQKTASLAAGFGLTGLNNLERRSARDAVRMRTLRRLLALFEAHGPGHASLSKLKRILEGGLIWDRVVEVRDTGASEPIYDLEIRPGGRPVENFVAGRGGLFVSNTAGFVDAGWSGHLTLELSNVSNLPVTIYPGMKIGQLCVFQMSSPAERSYAKTGKYQGQRGPTPSKFYMDFTETKAALARARRAAKPSARRAAKKRPRRKSR